MTRRLIPAPALAMVAALGLSACGSSAPTRFWTIESVSAKAPPAALAIPPVQIGTVHVPLAIDRLEVVQHDAANRITVRDFDRWSAPPGNLMRTALTQDLVARLPGGSVIFPDLSAPPGTRIIAVEILDLIQTEGRFVMTASWSATGTPQAHRQLQLSAPAGTGDVAAQTQALGMMTADLADSIADAMTTPHR